MSKKIARDPLLYIQQPDVKKPNVSMQSNFKTDSRKVNKNKVEDEPDFNQVKIPRRRIQPSYQREGFTEDIDQNEVDDIAKAEAETETGTKAENFKQMSVEEKIMYFTEQPQEISRITCEIKTENKTYYGKIISYEDGEVLIQPNKKVTRERLLFTDIIDINMIGF